MDTNKMITMLVVIISTPTSTIILLILYCTSTLSSETIYSQTIWLKNHTASNWWQMGVITIQKKSIQKQNNNTIRHKISTLSPIKTNKSVPIYGSHNPHYYLLRHVYSSKPSLQTYENSGGWVMDLKAPAYMEDNWDDDAGPGKERPACWHI